MSLFLKHKHANYDYKTNAQKLLHNFKKTVKETTLTIEDSVQTKNLHTAYETVKKEITFNKKNIRIIKRFRGEKKVKKPKIRPLMTRSVDKKKKWEPSRYDI